MSDTENPVGVRRSWENAIPAKEFLLTADVRICVENVEVRHSLFLLMFEY